MSQSIDHTFRKIEPLTLWHSREIENFLSRVEDDQSSIDYEQRLEENKDLIDTVQAAAQKDLDDRKRCEEAAEAALHAAENGRSQPFFERCRSSTLQKIIYQARREVMRRRGDPEAAELTFIQVLCATMRGHYCQPSDDDLCNFVARVIYDRVKEDYLDHDLKYTTSW